MTLSGGRGAVGPRQHDVADVNFYKNEGINLVNF